MSGKSRGHEVVMAEKPDVQKFENTEAYSPRAIFFDKHGYYTTHPRGTQGYYDFWDEEKERCLYGYTPPETGIKITGFHYFYLNYCRMQKVRDVTLPDGTVQSERTTSWPSFYDTDFFYFHYLDQCRRKNRHMIVLKARRKGFSYKAAAMMCRNYFLLKHSKNFVFAGLKEYLTGVDAILTKAWEIMSFVDDHTAWTQPKLLDRPMEKTSGYKKKTPSGSYVEKGNLSSIAGVSLKDDPDKVRGKAGELIFFEEAGAFPGLLDAWEVAMPTMRQGNKTLGTMVAFGTGGTEGVGFESLDEMFYHPAAYECLAFENVWSEANYGTLSGYFCPIYEILDGFLDDDGNSDVQSAKEFELEMREVKRQGNNPKNYDKYLAEHPFSPEEATLQVSGNMFNMSLIKDQLDRVKANDLAHKMGMPGRLRRTPEGVKFTPDADVKPIYQFPHRGSDDTTGGVVVYESPYKPQGVVPNFLYYICHDPYGQDKAQTSSLGAAYVMKAVNNVSQPDDMIVASYVGRPGSQDEYNSNLFALAEYYNAKIGFENDRGDVIGYAKRTRRLHMLQPEFEMLHQKELQSKTVNRKYGMHMVNQRKLQAEIYLRDWMELPRSKGTDGSMSLNIHKIYDPALLTEMLKFNQDGNFDRVMALFVGMFHSRELFNVDVQERNVDRSSDNWFDNQYDGNPILGYPPDIVTLDGSEDITGL